MRGFIEHDGRECELGIHSNRFTTKEMCPIFLALRRQRLKETMRERRFEEFLERGRRY